MSEATTQATPIVEPRSLDSLTSTQYDKFMLTGEMPEAKVKEAPKESKESAESAATAEVTEAATEQATESATEAQPQEKKTPTKMGYGELRNRVRELEAENSRLKTKPEPTEAKTEPAPVQTEAKRDDLRAKPTKDDMVDGKPKFQTYEDFIEDLADWRAEKRFSDLKAEDSRKEQERAAAEEGQKLSQTFKENVDAYKSKHPDVDIEHAINPEDGPSSEIVAGSFMDMWILKSPDPMALLVHFDNNREDLHRIGKMSVLEAGRELTKLEIKLDEPPKAEATPAKKVTKAPPPAREVGGRGSTAVDEVDKALEEGDTGAYIEAMNRRAIAAQKR